MNGLGSPFYMNGAPAVERTSKSVRRTLHGLSLRSPEIMPEIMLGSFAASAYKGERGG